MKPGPKPQEVTPGMKELLSVIAQRGPISRIRLAEITGRHHSLMDRWIRRLRDHKMIHIGGYGDSEARDGRWVKLYAAGAGEDAKRPPPKVTKAESMRLYRKRKAEREAKAKRAPIIRRDPFIAQFFGNAAV